VGLSFTPEQREMMVEDLNERLEDYEALRKVPLPNEVAPALRLDLASTELTQLCLKRLKAYNPLLKAVITLTEERALRQAEQADKELDAGHWRGPLHGIPWGAKDLLAVKGYPTTWGAMPYKDQVIDEDVVWRKNA